MKGNATAALAALGAVNTVGLVALFGALASRGEPPAAAADERLAALEERLARLEAAAPRVDRAPSAVPASGAPEAADAPPAAPVAPGAPGPGAPPAVADDRPVTRAEVQALVKEQLARQAAAPATAPTPAPAIRPKRSLPDVARELGLDARQEGAVDALLRQVERDSMKLLFEVDDVGLEQLKGELAQAERDPRLKEQLRERLAVNWTRRQSEIGVLWVRMDARLRESLGPELLQKFYGFDVQREGKEFPDIQQMFFAPPAKAAETEGR
jgi:hypothetical protein